MAKTEYRPEEPFLLFFHGGEWDAMLRQRAQDGRPWEIAAGLLWCEMSRRSAEDFAAELQKHEVPGMPGASWDRVAAHMVWELLLDSPRLRPTERQGSLFA